MIRNLIEIIIDDDEMFDLQPEDKEKEIVISDITIKVKRG